MERNSNDTFGSGTSTPAGSAGGTSSSASDSNFTRDAGNDSAGLADRARAAAGSAATAAGEKLSDVGSAARDSAGAAGGKLSDAASSVRDKAGNLKHTLADALESGAGRLRQQGAGGGQVAGAAATGGSTGMIADDNRLGQATNQLAGGMQGAADWLRDADMDSVKSGIERQVKEHPGRSLAVAVGLGYLLGKALRK